MEGPPRALGAPNLIHHDIDPHGRLGPGRLHLGEHIPDALARYLGCDAEIILAAHQHGTLLGITPAVRAPSRALRRAIEHRDGGCTHPLCDQTRWWHIHHLTHWEHGGRTVPTNLLALCQRHHRALHHGEFTIAGNPEDWPLVFNDNHGRPIEPPGTGPPAPADPGPTPYTPPYGEPLNREWFGWN